MEVLHRVSGSPRDMSSYRRHDKFWMNIVQVADARQASPASSIGVDPLDRFGADADRWEPGSDFESKTVTRSGHRRVHDTPAPAAASQGIDAARSFSGSVEGSVDRSELCLAWFMVLSWVLQQGRVLRCRAILSMTLSSWQAF